MLSRIFYEDVLRIFHPLRPCSEYCSCVNSNCENPYNEVEDDCEVEDDDSESDSENESF